MKKTLAFKFAVVLALVGGALATALLLVGPFQGPANPSPASAPSEGAALASGLGTGPGQAQTAPVTIPLDTAVTVVRAATRQVEPVVTVSKPSTLAPGWPRSLTFLAGGAAAVAALAAFVVWRRRVSRPDGGMAGWVALLVAIGLLAALAPPALAQTADQWPLQALGVSQPHITRFNVDGAGNVFFTEPGGQNIGRLNPATNAVTVWLSPVAPGLHMSVQDGVVWFTGQSPHSVGRLDPATNMFTIWLLASSSLPLVPHADAGGNVYFVQSQASKIGRINPVTNQLTEWTIPTANSNPNWTFVEPAGATVNVWFAESGGNKIGRLGAGPDGVLGTDDDVITEWPIPGPGTPGGIFVSGGKVWFTESSANAVSVLTPANNQLTRFSASPLFSSIKGGFRDGVGNFWFLSATEFAAGRLNTDNTFTRYNLPTPPGVGAFLKTSDGLSINTATGQVYFASTFTGAAGTVGRLTP